MSREETFVVMRVGDADWAVREASVARVVAAEGWRGPPPIDVAASAGLTAAPDAGSARLIVLRDAHGEVPISAIGRLSIRSAEPSSVLDLPPVFADTEGPIRIAAVVLDDGQRPLLVLDTDALLAHLAHAPRASQGGARSSHPAEIA